MSVVLPVIDLKRGQVVHGFAGERHRYQPIQSQLIDSPHPGKVAKAICDYMRCSEIYVADLDAIAGDDPDWNGYELIRKQGVKLWLDSGTGDIESIRRVVERLDCRVIVALETLKTLRSLEDIVAAFPNQELVFSLDLDAEQPMACDAAASRLSAETIASYAVESGISTMIVLDVAAVGTGNTKTVDLCRNIRSRHLDLELVSGGGVRDQQDVQRFVEAGCNRVLVASAIHSKSL